MPGFTSADYVHATLLQGVAALNCAKGIIGGATPGAPRDTEFFGCVIAKNAAPATLTVTGLNDSGGAAQSWVINGSTTADTPILLPWPLLNEFAAFTFQPSVAGAIWVYTRAYVGP